MWRVKRQIGEITRDEPITLPEKKFEADIFNCFLSTTLISLKERVEWLLRFLVCFANFY